MGKNSRICKICNKSFSNGKAMGGHMRSHLAKLPIPPKPRLIKPKSPTPSSYSSSLNNFSKTRKYFDDKVVNSKRRRKAITRPTLIETDQVSSILSDDTFYQVEEVARCLIMLSRDTWAKRNENISCNKLIENHDYDGEEEDEYDLLSNKSSQIRVRTSKKSNNYKCDKCNKMFKSYQALGGHRANHKKITNQNFDSESHNQEDEEGDGNSFNNSVIKLKKSFECPICFKVFGSGKALGGHKKVHFSYVTSNINSRINNISSVKFRDINLIIDLNLPAPQEDVERYSPVRF